MRRATMIGRLAAGCAFALAPLSTARAALAQSVRETPPPDDATLHRAIVAARPSLMQRLRIRRIVKDKQISPGARPDLIQAVLTTDQRTRFYNALKRR